MPKQLIPFIRGKSLLRIAADRLEGLIDAERQYICTAEAYRAAIREAMPRFRDEHILGEPVGRNTLNAVGFAAAVIGKHDPQAAIAVFTADHLIEPAEEFRRKVETAFDIVQKIPGSLVTFGITPTHAATGYGYVQVGEALPGFDPARRVGRFKEKPDRATAEQYVASGQYLWNSGMFVWRAATLMDCIERYCPQAHEGLSAIAAAWGTAKQNEVLERVYPTLPKHPVDTAVMERAAEDERVTVVTVPMNVRWLDVGNWASYGETCDKDAHGNRLAADRAALLDTRDALIVSEDPNHLIAAIGVEGLIVVHTKTATLICRADEAERIKDLHAEIERRFGGDYI